MMKKIALFVLFVISIESFSQSSFCTVLQQPCNDDGILLTTASPGLTLPISYYYNTSNGIISHSNVFSHTDTLFNIGYTIYSVYGADNSGNSFGISSTGITPAFSIDLPNITHAVCPNLTGTGSITINGGTSPLNVDWYLHVPSAPGTTTLIGSGNPMTLPPGYYSIAVTDSNGCVVRLGSDSIGGFPVNHISGFSYNINTTAANCTNGTATIPGIIGGTAPFSYSWSNGATSSSLIGLATGSYSVTVTDAQGCYENNYCYINQAVTIYANTVVTPATCTLNDGAVTTFGSGGTPPYTFTYSNGATGSYVSGLSGNTYLSIIVTDANGCTGTGSAYISATSPVMATYSSSPSSCTSPTGSATVSITGGTFPYSVVWNTSPAVTGTSISGVPAGNYAFTITDATGCVRTGVATIPQQSILTTTTFSTPPTCPANTGIAGVTPSGTNPPFSYLWNTGATTSSISSIPAGYYICTITDNVGCTLIKYFPLPATSNITIAFSSTIASCIFTNDGTITATVSGGTPPYSYHWSDGQTTATAINLLKGDYWLTVTDANGCSRNKYIYLGYNPTTDFCYCTISGKVYDDANTNCLIDAGEQGIENIMMHCSGGIGYTFTDVNGNYSFKVPTGSYIISEILQASSPLSPCQTNNFTYNVVASSGCVYNLDFANNPPILHDIAIERISLAPPVPGNSYTQLLRIKNRGTVNESTIQLGYRDDGQINLSSTNPSVYFQPNAVGDPNWYNANTGVPSLNPGANTDIVFNSLVPTNIPLATVLDYRDTANYQPPISDWITDYSPWNNVCMYNPIVIGSYDPNYKEVSPKGIGTTGKITKNDSVLHYIIHFQNTGTYYAQNIVVKDTLSSNLDWESIKIGSSDHNFTATLNEDGILTFTFANINLPWKQYSELLSRGYVSFSIKLKRNLAVGTVIKNKAAIYFDYNAPVITNETVNTIYQPGNTFVNENISSITPYPNPAANLLYVQCNDLNIKDIVIYDLQGRILKQESINSGDSIHIIDVSTLSNGLYIVSIRKNNNGEVKAKFIKHN